MYQLCGSAPHLGVFLLFEFLRLLNRFVLRTRGCLLFLFVDRQPSRLFGSKGLICSASHEEGHLSPFLKISERNEYNIRWNLCRLFPNSIFSRSLTESTPTLLQIPPLGVLMARLTLCLRVVVAVPSGQKTIYVLDFFWYDPFSFIFLPSLPPPLDFSRFPFSFLLLLQSAYFDTDICYQSPCLWFNPMLLQTPLPLLS